MTKQDEIASFSNARNFVWKHRETEMEACDVTSTPTEQKATDKAPVGFAEWSATDAAPAL